VEVVTMRFSDKLAKQRKNNNLSQEQLADKLGVSRQAVSKWESGSSYPDMDKMIKICGILNCTLEDLLDDGVISDAPESSNKNKINIQVYMQDLLSAVTKTMNMFITMTFKQKIKCIFEMICYICLLFVFGGIVSLILHSLTSSIFDLLPYRVSNFLNIIFSQVCFVILLILGVIIFIHLFKIRYLDYFVTIEDQNVNDKTIEEPIEKKENKHYIEKAKEKIIIRDQKHSSFSFINLLWKMVVLIIKCCVAFIAIVAIFSFIALVVASVICLTFIRYNSIFFYAFLGLLAITVINFLIIYYFYHFLFNKAYFIKKTFLIFCGSLIVIGISFGLMFTKALQFDYINTYSDLTYETVTETIPYDDFSRFYIYVDTGNITYVIDNTLTNSMKVEISYPTVFSYSFYSHDLYNNQTETYDRVLTLHGNTYFHSVYKTVLSDLKNDTIRDYNSYIGLKVTIYISEDQLSKLPHYTHP